MRHTTTGKERLTLAARPAFPWTINTRVYLINRTSNDALAVLKHHDPKLPHPQWAWFAKCVSCVVLKVGWV